MTEDGGVVLLSGCDLKAGDPIEIEYLQESGGGNRDLLLEYGFAEVLRRIVTSLPSGSRRGPKAFGRIGGGRRLRLGYEGSDLFL